MDPSESLDWYSGLHIVEEGEDAAAAAAAAARAAEKQPEESISSVIGSAFSGMVSTEDCMMSGLMQQQQLQQPPADLQQQQQLRPSVLQHTNDHQHHHRESQPHHQSHPRHIIQSTANHQDHAHHHQSVIVQPSTETSSGSAGYGSGGHFPSSSFLPPSTSTASNLFLPHSFMGLSFPEFETSQLPYPVLHSSHQHPSLDLFDPNHWMGVLDGKKEGGNTRRPSFTEAIFPQVFGTAAGQGILDFGSCAAAAAATATASQQQQQHHAALKHDPLDALYLSPSLPSTLSSPSLIPSSLQAPPTPKGLLVGGGGVGTVSSGYGTSTVIREAVLDMEKPEDREMMEQECQVCMATTANGLHFGARTCAACAAFFRRSVADAKQYQCKGSQRCTNSAKDGTGYRKICRACRLQRCLQIGMQPENVQNKRFRKEDMPMGGTMISDLVGKGQGKGTAIDSLLKINFNQPFGTMGQMQLQQQQSHLHQSAPQSFYC